ncbi:RDD family protein [Mycolicibacterium stellerae]|uniref:RDD family protein n=1 Tax=Mycolicibacterium stellerae TaxID=2358193 RepID=UPI000F0B3F96|nr:RDD family protein [Mycolicibacterium stellerae]
MTGPDGPETAGIVSRGVAAVIDLVVVGAVIGLLYLGLVLSRLLFNPTGFALPALDALFSTAAVLVVSALYLAAAWAVSGCTVGAVVMGLRVVGRRSERVPLLVATLRAIACVLFPVGLLSVAVDRRRRSVQDFLLGTRVVYVRR